MAPAACAETRGERGAEKADGEGLAVGREGGSSKASVGRYRQKICRRFATKEGREGRTFEISAFRIPSRFSV